MKKGLARCPETRLNIRDSKRLEKGGKAGRKEEREEEIERDGVRKLTFCNQDQQLAGRKGRRSMEKLFLKSHNNEQAVTLNPE